MHPLGVPAVAAAVLWALAPGAAAQEALAERPLDPGALRAVYLDLLGRPPFQAEREAWRGRPLVELVDALFAGQELWDRWLEEQLYFYLLIDNFRPRTDAVEAIPAELSAGRIGVREATHRIAISSSFDRRNPGPDTFVSVVLEQLLGVTVQESPRDLEAGKRLYDGEEALFLGRKGASQADVVRFAIEDERFVPELLRREHARLLRRDPDRKSLAEASRRLAEDPLAFPAILKGWILGPGYAARLSEKIPQPNRLYVRAMYVDLVDRLPDAEEERRMRGALDGLSDPGPLRSVLARMVLDSGAAAIPAKEDVQDPTAWVAGLFERLLGRAATSDELARFVSAFHDPECRTSTVVYAIVSHPEYQRF